MRKQTRNLLYGAMFLLFMVLLTGCAPKISMCKLIPGGVTEAAQMKKIAVAPFDGNFGTEFSVELESSLASIRVNDAPFYEVVNRNALDKILEEQKLTMSGLVDTKSAVNLGKLLGAQGLYVGQITTAKYNDTPYKEDRSECVATNDKGKCVSWRSYTVNCTKRTAQLTVVPKLVDVETAKIAYSQTFNETEVAKGCRDTTAPKDGSQMLTELRNAVIRKIRLDVAPHTEIVEVKLLTDTDDITSEAAKEKLNQGMAFAKNNRMSRACEIWEEAKSLAPSSISYLHNLAVCAEMNGNLELAQALLSEADKKLVKPNDIISASLGRVGIEIARNRKLEEQMNGKKK